MRKGTEIVYDMGRGKNLPGKFVGTDGEKKAVVLNAAGKEVRVPLVSIRLPEAK